MTSPAPTRNPFLELIDSLASLRHVQFIFWICLAIYCLDGAAYFGVLNLLTPFLGHEGPVGLSDEWSGYTVAYMTGMLTFFSATCGFISDRLGVRRTITLTVLCALVGRSLLNLAPRLGGAVVFSLAGTQVPLSGVISWGALTFIAFSAGVLQPACYAGVKQATTKESSAIGFSLLYALMNGGIVLESFASSPVRASYGFSGVFWMCVGITALYLVLHVVLFPSTAGNPVPQPPSDERSWRDHALANPRFLFFIFVLLGVRTLFAHQWLTMPQYVLRAYPPEVGARFEWINGLNPLIILVGTPLLAGLTRRVHVVTMMIAGTLVSAAATFLIVPGPNLTALLSYVIVFSIGEALWSSRFLEYVADVAPPDKVGLYMGVAQIPWFLAKTTTGFYSGFMLKTFCPPVGGGAQHTGTMWLVYAVFGMTTPLGLILAQRWLKAGRLDDHVRKAPAAAA